MNLETLYNQLKQDRWRKDHAFSEDLEKVNRLLFDPFATEGERREQLMNWLQKYQSCVFGRVAAALNRLHICVLTETDFLTRTDNDIRNIIRRQLHAWKRRSVQPLPTISVPAHGFVLLVAAPRIALAAPDEHLFEFASKLLELWGCPKTVEPQGAMHWETLYIQNPTDRSYVRFTFSVDFFGAQGDGRWWHDHRCPGGLLFTANSVGHMRKFREWYEKREYQKDWVLQNAMLTIDGAWSTPYGKAMWLKPLGENRQPTIPHVPCPFVRPEKLKKQLVDKDWTRYGGFVHSDHSIRREFFLDEAPEPKIDIRDKEYLQDFMYLYDGKAKDYLKFIDGETVSQEQIETELGPQSSWTEWQQGGPGAPQIAPRAEAKAAGTAAERKEIAVLLEEGRQWRLSQEERDALNEDA